MVSKPVKHKISRLYLVSVTEQTGFESYLVANPGVAQIIVSKMTAFFMQKSVDRSPSSYNYSVTEELTHKNCRVIFGEP